MLFLFCRFSNDLKIPYYSILYHWFFKKCLLIDCFGIFLYPVNTKKDVLKVGSLAVIIKESNLFQYAV